MGKSAQAILISAIMLTGCLEGPAGKDGKDGADASGAVGMDSLKFSLFDLYLFTLNARDFSGIKRVELSQRAAASLDSAKGVFRFDSIEIPTGKSGAVMIRPEYAPAHWEMRLRYEGFLDPSPDSSGWWAKETFGPLDSPEEVDYYTPNTRKIDPWEQPVNASYYEGKGFQLDNYVCACKGYGVIYYRR